MALSAPSPSDTVALYGLSSGEVQVTEAGGVATQPSAVAVASIVIGTTSVTTIVSWSPNACVIASWFASPAAAV